VQQLNRDGPYKCKDFVGPSRRVSYGKALIANFVVTVATLVGWNCPEWNCPEMKAKGPATGVPALQVCGVIWSP
jgi:hypothetical protein